MGKNLTFKILEAHLLEGELIPGKEIAIRIDHTLSQDATGTIAMLEFEELGMEKVKVKLAAQYVDHNILQTDNKNAEDHRYLQTACARYGIIFSRPGNIFSSPILRPYLLRISAICAYRTIRVTMSTTWMW